MKFGSLFTGIGGLDLGLERAGMTCAWQVEIDPYARRVLEKHWPNVYRFDDVREVCGRGCDFTDTRHVEPVDLICGGFPCQDISVAGKGAGLAGARSGLWREYRRVIEDVRPSWVLIENVPALRSRGLGTVLRDLSALGFDAEWDCLPASAFGAYHRRDRVFVVAHALRPGLEGPRLRWTAPDSAQWSPEPDVGRVAHGVPARVDRLRCLGNAVVPQVAEYVGRLIMGAAR